MKKRILLLVIVLALSLCGCVLPKSMMEQTTPPTTLAPVPETTQEPEVPETTAAIEATQPATEPDPTETVQPQTTEPEFEPYLLKIRNAELPIFAGPGYEHDQVGAIRDHGTYTIVEEKQVRSTDAGLVIWGRLKSGAGWIDLADAKYAQNGYCMICGIEREEGNDSGICVGCGFGGGEHTYCDRCGKETTYRGDVDGLCEDCAAGDPKAPYHCSQCGKECGYANVRGMCYDCWKTTPNRYCIKCGQGWFTEVLTGGCECPRCGYEFES